MSPNAPRRQRTQCSAKSLRHARKSCANKELQLHGVEDGLEIAPTGFTVFGRRGQRRFGPEASWAQGLGPSHSGGNRSRRKDSSKVPPSTQGGARVRDRYNSAWTIRATWSLLMAACAAGLRLRRKKAQNAVRQIWAKSQNTSSAVGSWRYT